MKNKISFCFLFCLQILICNAQQGEWTWMSGSSANNASGVFGTKGVPSVNNHPPGLYEVANWVDNQGNFWLYAGIGPNINVFGDLWKFDPTTLEWTWVNGTSTFGVLPVYGVKGVPAATNNPGTRSWGICSWTDQSGDLWFFGGQTMNGIINDLWKYSISTNLWTWISGDTVNGSLGNYGVQGVPSVNNFPPGRNGETATAWVDDNGDFWLFGGQRDDLWRYTVSTNEWTWMNGSQLTGTAVSFGSKGIPSATNTPGARSTYTHWKDAASNFWLFGSNQANDMWKYDFSVNQWVWMSGTNIFGDPGVYNATCVSDTFNCPASRFEHKQCWTDACKNFWLMGGLAGAGCINDLWKFDPQSLEWTWVNGTNIPNSASVYGTLGVSSPANVCGSREGGSGWVDASNNLWLYGGCNAGYSSFYADMWRFVPDPSCSQCVQTPQALFTAPNHICPGTCTDFVNLSQGATSFLWSFPGGNPSVSTDVNPTNICYNTPGNYDVELIAVNSFSSDTLLLNNFVTVYPYPPPQGILQSGDTLFANQGAVSYQWYEDGVLIPGATNYFYVALESGNYNVVATDINDCEVEAVIFDVIASTSYALTEEQVVTLFPNPVDAEVIVNIPTSMGSDQLISVYNLLAEKMTVAFKKEEGSNNYSADVSGLAKGMYYVEVSSGTKLYRTVMMKK